MSAVAPVDVVALTSAPRATSAATTGAAPFWLATWSGVYRPSRLVAFTLAPP